MANNSHDKAPAWRNRITAIVAIGATAFGGGAVLSGCTPDKAPPAAMATQSGGETPSAEASPTDNAELDAFRDELVTKREDGSVESVKTLQEVFPLPEQFTATQVDANPESIPEIFPISAHEAKTPQDAMRAWFIRENAAINLGSGDSSMVLGADGSDALKTESKRNYLAAWRATNGFGPESRPPQAYLDNQTAAATAFTGTAVARGLDHPAFTPLVAKIPNIAEMNVKDNNDGTFDADVEVRGVFYVDNINIQLVDPTITFKSIDIVETVRFTNCGINEETDTFQCRPTK